MKQNPLKKNLREAGLKATPKRLAVLNFLSKQKQPLSVDSICRRFPKTNTVTVYRMLEAMFEADLLTKHDLGHGHYDYELTKNDEHHHHLVCLRCGEIEDVDLCQDIRDNALRQSKKFAEVSKHMVTIFGRCKNCFKIT